MVHAGRQLRGGQFAVWLASAYQSINFALTASLSGACTPEQVHAALGKLRSRHSGLATRLIEEPQRRVVAVTDPDLEIPVRIVQRQHAAQWREEVAGELGQAFDLSSSAPLRVVWLRGAEVSEMAFVCPHALADGLSVAYLVRDFLAFLGQPDREPAPLPPSPAMNDLIPEFAGKRAIVWQSRAKSAFFRLLLRLNPKVEMQPREKVDYHLLAWALTPAQTASLVARSRAEGTTVHAALSTAFLRAFGELRGDGWKRRVQSPVSLRERLSSPVGEAFGLYVNLAEVTADCAPRRDFWHVARAIKQAFVRQTGDRRIFRSLIEANIVMDDLGAIMPPAMVARTVTAVAYDLSISNLGRLNVPMQVGALHLDELYGPALGGNPKDIVLGANTTGGQLQFVLSFTDLKLSPTQAAQVRDRAMHWLDYAAG